MHTKFRLNTYSKLSNQVHLKKSDKLYPTPDLFAFLLGKNCWKKGCCQAWVNSSNKNHHCFQFPGISSRQFLGGFREASPKNQDDFLGPTPHTMETHVTTVSFMFFGVIIPIFLGLKTFIFHGFGIQRQPVTVDDNIFNFMKGPILTFTFYCCAVGGLPKGYSGRCLQSSAFVLSKRHSSAFVWCVMWMGWRERLPRLFWANWPWSLSPKIKQAMIWIQYFTFLHGSREPRLSPCCLRFMKIPPKKLHGIHGAGIFTQVIIESIIET